MRSRRRRRGRRRRRASERASERATTAHQLLDAIPGRASVPKEAVRPRPMRGLLRREERTPRAVRATLRRPSATSHGCFPFSLPFGKPRLSWKESTVQRLADAACCGLPPSAGKSELPNGELQNMMGVLAQENSEMPRMARQNSPSELHASVPSVSSLSCISIHPQELVRATPRAPLSHCTLHHAVAKVITYAGCAAPGCCTT